MFLTSFGIGIERRQHDVKEALGVEQQTDLGPARDLHAFGLEHGGRVRIHPRLEVGVAVVLVDHFGSTRSPPAT